MNWLYLLAFALGVWIGYNIPAAKQQYQSFKPTLRRIWSPTREEILADRSKDI